MKKALIILTASLPEMRNANPCKFTSEEAWTFSFFSFKLSL